MRIRNLVEKDSNSTRFSYQNYDTPPEFDGTPLSKTSKSPDCEHALVPPLTRNAQMKRRF